MFISRWCMSCQTIRIHIRRPTLCFCVWYFIKHLYLPQQSVRGMFWEGEEGDVFQTKCQVVFFPLDSDCWQSSFGSIWLMWCNLAVFVLFRFVCRANHAFFLPFAKDKFTVLNRSLVCTVGCRNCSRELLINVCVKIKYLALWCLS